MVVIKSVLIADDLNQGCAAILESNGISVTTKTKLDPQSLIEALQNKEAVIVRSATTITKDILEACPSLRLIGRAGTGVDNIDVEAATQRGVIVMNTPDGNSRSAAELTCGMIMALARNIVQGSASIKLGQWERKTFMGVEVSGKTLAIIGLGRIGREVALRMQAFGMKTIGFDPLVSPAEAGEFGVQWSSLEDIWPQADYITVHVPLIPKTKGLISADVFSKCKRGVQVINCARGGIIDEGDLLAALQDGRCGGAALDVFVEEPPKNMDLITNPRVIATPHLGASTKEAQVRVALDVAEQIVKLVHGEALIGAVNAHAVTFSLDRQSRSTLDAVRSLAAVASALCGDATEVLVSVPEFMQKMHSGLKAAAVVGALGSGSENGLNLINASLIAAERNLDVQIYNRPSTADDMSIHVSVTALRGPVTVKGLVGNPCPLLTEVDGVAFKRPVPLANEMFVGKHDADIGSKYELEYLSSNGKICVAAASGGVALAGMAKVQF